MALARGSVSHFSTKLFCVVNFHRPLIPLALLVDVKRSAEEAIVIQLLSLYFWRFFVLVNAPPSSWSCLPLGEKSPAKANQ